MQLILLTIASILGSALGQPGCTTAPAPSPTNNVAAPYIVVNLVRNDLSADPKVGQQVVQAFTDAANRWSQIIKTDLPNITVKVDADLQSRCGAGAIVKAGTTVDNMIIFANVQNIDGVGQILGQSAPCIFSNVNGKAMPRVGTMTFDAADVQQLLTKNLFATTVLHEMGHIIGIGSAAWQQDLVNAQTNDPRYGGQGGVNGIRGFQQIGGQGVLVPVENVGGAGTRNAHWRTSFFGPELMTGFLQGPSGLSAMTIGSLVDLGYAVDPSKADTFQIKAANTGGRLLEEEHDHDETYRHLDANGGWENVTWPDISSEAAMLGPDGMYIGKTENVEADIARQDQANSSNAGVIVGAAVGGAFVALSVVAVIVNMRRKNETAVTSTSNVSHYDPRKENPTYRV